MLLQQRGFGSTEAHQTFTSSLFKRVTGIWASDTQLVNDDQANALEAKLQPGRAGVTVDPCERRYGSTPKLN
jgi:hypothetical protein